MTYLVPAILTKESADLTKKISVIESVPVLRDVQVDFADGEFVPNRTILPDEIDRPVTKLNLEAHLMVTTPDKYLHRLVDFGFQIIIVHYEALVSDTKIIDTLGRIKSLGARAGLAVNPDSDPGIIDQVIGQLDLALVMGVNPGFQGSPFIPESIDRLGVLRKKYKDVILEIDGGISKNNIQDAVQAGADRAVVGSAIWKSDDPVGSMHELLKLINNQ